MLLYYLINIWKAKQNEAKVKQNKADKRKLYPTLPGWPTCACLYGKFSFCLGGIPAKSSEITPRRDGSPPYEQPLTVFKSFLLFQVSICYENIVFP